MKKRLFRIVVILALCLTALSATALATSNPETYTFDISEGRITIVDGSTTGMIAVKYGSDQTITADIDPSQVITVTGSFTGTANSQTDHNLLVQTSTPVTIKASNLTIDNARSQYCYAMALEGANANVKLILEGENYFAGGQDKAGITVGAGKTLTIEGTGSVTAKGGLNVGGAGIGGGGLQNCGTVIINSGTVEAIGGTGGAGIGGGCTYSSSSTGGNGGNIVINGGTVTATGGSGAADIGGGSQATDNGTLSGSGSAVITATHNNVMANTDNFTGTINGVQYTSDFGVTVNGTLITNSNQSDVLGDSKVSYDPDTNTLSVNGFQSSNLTVSGNGSTDVVVNGTSGAPAVGALTVTGAKDVTVTANYGGPGISGAANITCSGNVKIANAAGMATGYSLTVNGAGEDAPAQNVTVTANYGGPGISGAANITCSGDVKIDNEAGFAVGGFLSVTGAQNVTVTANYNGSGISGAANITCSGNVEIANVAGMAAGYSLTVNGAGEDAPAQNVTVTANYGGPGISGGASIACTGNVMIKNEGSGIGVQGTLAVTGAQDVTVTAAGSGQAVSGNTEIACSGDVTLTSDSGMVVSGKLTVTGAQDVTVTANCSDPAITNVVDLTCSGNVKIANEGSGNAVAGKLTITGAQDVTVTSNGYGPTITGAVELTCSGNVLLINKDTGMVTGTTLTVNGAKDVTVTANSGSPAIGGPAKIGCSGNINITNDAGMAMGSTLTVTGAQDVTVTANCSDPAISNAANIACSGNVKIANEGSGNASGNAVAGKLTIAGAQDVTVTSNGYGPTITGAVELTCSGNVLLINKDTGMVTGATLTVNGAKDVTVTANSGYPAIPGSYGSEFAAKLICSGNVTITNNGNMALGGSLIVTGAKDVAVTGGDNNPVIAGDVALTCSGNVVLTSKGTGMVAPGKVTITGAQNVTVTANSDSTPVFPGPVDLTCSGDVEIVNLGTSSAVNQALQFRKTDGHGYAVKTGTDLDNLAVYAEKAADETFGPETLDAPVVKITTAHSLTKTEAVDPTCTEGGSSAYYTCSVCEKYFSDAEGKTEIAKDSWILDAAGHSLTKTEAVDPTCTEGGSSAYYTCSVCDKYFSDAEGTTEIAKDSWILDAAGHSLSKTEAVDATCTEAGNSAYYTCSVCDKYFSDAEGKTEIEKDSWVISATGHSLSKAEAKDATCTEAGNSAYYTCSVCDKYFSDAEGKTEIEKDSWVISATGHTPSAWEHNGTQHWRSCTVCNAELDRADHVFSGATCGVCGYSIVNPFVDVTSDRYYYNAVLWAVNNGITRGTTATTFSPDAPCTRAQTVTFLWRAAGCPAPSGSQTPFTDVVPGSFYEKAVQWAVETGVTKGTSATTFSPDMTCNRAQVVTFLWRYQGKPAAGSTNPFTDVAANAYYTNAVLWAVENDITRGTTATTFSPDEPCTRAQNVTFLYRCMK